MESALPDNYCYGEIALGRPGAGGSDAVAPAPPDATIIAPKASLETILDQAKKIWKIVRDSKDSDEQTLAALQKEYVDFCHSFPIILRWMVQCKQFSAKAFRTFLLKSARPNDGRGGASPNPTREAFLLRQVDYLVLLRRERGHPSARELERYRKTMSDAILAEDAELLKICEAVSGDLAKKAESEEAARRRHIYEMLTVPRAGGADARALLLSPPAEAPAPPPEENFLAVALGRRSGETDAAATSSARLMMPSV
jgi:hypothetical protein